MISEDFFEVEAPFLFHTINLSSQLDQYQADFTLDIGGVQSLACVSS